MSDIIFVDGLMIKPPHEKAPDFVKCAISIKREALITWLRAQTDEWINIDVKESKKGAWYASVNDWSPQKKDSNSQPASESSSSSDDFKDDIPF